MTVKSSISLTDEQDAFARALVEKGRYASVSAVLQHGMELLRLQTERDELENEALYTLLKKRRKSAFVTPSVMKNTVSAMAKRKHRKHGV